MSCGEHPDKRSVGVCRSCDGEFCVDCLVFSFGRMKPPYCVACALQASGVHPAITAT